MSKHGGKRAGSGRPPLPAALKKQAKTVRLTQSQIDALVDEFGRFQTAIETLVTRYLVDQHPQQLGAAQSQTPPDSAPE